jgi:TRAP-type C4-dicarboxylate transport system permease small subunit
MKIYKIIQIVTSHLLLYLFVFLVFYSWVSWAFTNWFPTFFWLWDTRYISPTVRNIILLVMVVIVFPLASIFLEIERRKLKRKKEANLSTQEKKKER